MGKVRIWEEDIIIPTYEVGEADKNPMFIEKRVYQGSTGKVYPYPTTETISDEKVDKTYRAVFLENDFIKVTVLPELGGRIQRAFDKSNNYDFVYHNQVIKPALIGLLGPWISGGIEFNWPQHHRPTTFQSVDYTIKDNKDGSKTLWVSDVDQMYGTKGAAGFTIYPDKSYIEIKGQLYNRTPLPQTFLWWANPAVPSNDYTQSIFPPDVHSVYDHGKRDVSRFPIATGEYYKYDYSEGVDISRYKNIKVPTSYMAEKSEYDFVGHYDHKMNAGLLHIADHHISPGKKQWTWGNGDFGQVWDKSLTDEDGPYVELMTGVYTDNQPDFTWLKPFEEKTFKQYFMPYKDVGEVKNASIDAMLNMEISEQEVAIIIYSTGIYDHANLVLTYNGEEVVNEKISVSPTNTYFGKFENKDYNKLELNVQVIHNDKVLVEYQEKDQGIPELAEPAKEARHPKDIFTNEELYLTGQHIEQYRHATYLPDDYYLEGLKRDEFDTRINTAYGALLLRRGQFQQSAIYFNKSIKRLTELNPNPYDSESYYYLGLAQFYQRNLKESYSNFYKATWSNEQQEMSFYYLAAIAFINGDYDDALMFVNKALVKNSHNIKARSLKAIIYRYLNRSEEAQALLIENIEIDSFDYISRFENLYYDEKTLDELSHLVKQNHETFLQVARDYGEVGCYEEAIKVLSLDKNDKPLTHYYMAYYYDRLGKTEESLNHLKIADEGDPSYTFPSKLEDIAVLEKAAENYPEGAKAPYYLGNLYYDKKQYDLAIKLWEKSISLDDEFPTVYRNLSIAYFNKHDDFDGALTMIEKAFELNKQDARVLFELSQLRKKSGLNFEEQLSYLEDNVDILDKRDDLYVEYITLLNNLGQYEKALNALSNHSFHPWEGAEGKVPAQYKIALLGLSKSAISDNELDKAEELMQQALVYPDNFNEGKLVGTKDNNIIFTLGMIEEAKGNKEEAEKLYHIATQGHDNPGGVQYYYDQPADMILYQGFAFEKLGHSQEANKRYYRLLDYGEKNLYKEAKDDYFAVSKPDFQVYEEDIVENNKVHCYYLMGLGYLGLKNNKKALEYFEKTLTLDTNHQESLLYKEMCQN